MQRIFVKPCITTCYSNEFSFVTVTASAQTSTEGSEKNSRVIREENLSDRDGMILFIMRALEYICL